MTLPKIVGMDAWRKLAKSGEEALPQGVDGLMKEVFDSEPVLLKQDGTPANDVADAGGSRDIQVVFSSNAVDRDGDTIKQTGIKLTNYRKNPVVGLSHFRGADASGHFPIAKSVRLLRSEDNKKSFSVDRFVPRDMEKIGELAEATFQMVAAKFMRGVSLGFRPIKFTRPDEKKEEDRLKEFWWPLDFSSTEKLEHSFVPVGSNADALVGAKSAGIDISPIKMWAEKLLDQAGGYLVMERDRVEQAYKAANNNATLFMASLTGEDDDPFKKFLDTMSVPEKEDYQMDAKELAAEIVKGLKDGGVSQEPAPVEPQKEAPTAVAELKGSIDRLNDNFEKILTGKIEKPKEDDSTTSKAGEFELTEDDLKGITEATSKAAVDALREASGKLPA